MFIDIHSHAYRITPPVWRFCTPDALLRRYDKMKVDMAVILPIVSPEIYFPQPVEDVIEMCADHPDRLVPYCNIDPRSMYNSPYSPLDEIMAHYKAQGCRGSSVNLDKTGWGHHPVYQLFQIFKRSPLRVYLLQFLS